MRITIVYRYFWPDTAPYSRLLARMVPWLVEAGHDVRIIAGQPTYGNAAKTAPKQETVFGAEVVRLSLLPVGFPFAASLNMMLFSLFAATRVLFGNRTDIVWFGTTPPVIQAFLLNMAAHIRGALTIYQMQDIHPAIAIKAGILKQSLMTRILEKLDKSTLKSADLVTVLSEDMAGTVRTMSDNKCEPEIINNFAIEEVGEKYKPESAKPVRFCYAGNVGRFQNVDALVNLFSKLDASIAVLEIIGDGKLRASLEEKCRKGKVSSVRFLGEKSSLDTMAHLSSCNYGVVSLLPGLHPYAFPSKIQSYLAAGVPLFALVDKTSGIASMIDQHGLGFHADWQGGEKQILAKIEQVAGTSVKQNAKNTFPEAMWSPEYSRQRWLSVIERLGTQR